jgi:hypothetical protein
MDGAFLIVLIKLCCFDCVDQVIVKYLLRCSFICYCLLHTTSILKWLNADTFVVG